jgi:hypothetical protein
MPTRGNERETPGPRASTTRGPGVPRPLEMELMGIEPTTSGLQNRRSPS